MSITISETSVTAPVAYRSYHGGFFSVLISPEQTAGAMGIIDIRLPKGSEPPPHIHLHEDETFYLIDGEVSFEIGNETIIAKHGEAVFAPRGIAHRFTLNTAEARMLTMVTPGKFVDYFMEFSTPVQGEPQVTAPQGSPPTEAIAYMAQVLDEKYGVKFA
ncbi:cupin domain-containing protein [Mucilaginibacter gynuensis]|uniref:Cupin domain-containing protein n=1 Tax=Mucilaginibacter gynuensis TaxID=1302236 RepID=A0ABP8H8U0_9SPHI